MLTERINNFMASDDSRPESPRFRARCATLYSMTGIILNFLLFLMKVLAGILSGSIAVAADAVNNLTDAGSCAVTLIGFRLAARKADREHPYGHGRMEYLSGMTVSVLILLMGAELAWQSILRILHPQATSLGAVSILILLVSILVKYFLMKLSRCLSDLIGSSALRASSTDARNDCIATSAVLASLFLHHCTGLSVDGLCGLAVAAAVFLSGLKSLKETADPLLGSEPDAALIAAIEALVRETPGVLGMHDLVLHDYGPGTGMLTLHVEVNAQTSLADAHALADHLERTLSQRFGFRTVIHIDPSDHGNPLIRSIEETLRELLSDLDPFIRFHDLQLLRETDGTSRVTFDLNLPFDCRVTDEKALQTIQEKLTLKYPGICPVICIDHYDPALFS